MYSIGCGMSVGNKSSSIVMQMQGKRKTMDRCIADELNRCMRPQHLISILLECVEKKERNKTKRFLVQKAYQKKLTKQLGIL